MKLYYQCYKNQITLHCDDEGEVVVGEERCS